MKKISCLIIITICLAQFCLIAQKRQDTNSTMGLSASIQDNQFGIAVPVFIKNHFALVPGIELKYAGKVGTDLVIGLATRAYSWKKDPLSPYWGLKAGVLMFLPASENNMGIHIDFLTGVAMGVEYFLAPHFSVAIEPQLNVHFSGKESNRFGNPGEMGINTATMIIANIYF